MNTMFALIGFVVCPALLIALVRTRVRRPLHAALAAGAVVAVPCLLVFTFATLLAANNHNNHPLPLEIKVMLWGPLPLPAMTAIWMYIHKRGGGMRGLMNSTAMTLVAIPTNLVAFLRFLRRWGVNSNAEPPLVESPDSEGSISDNSGDAVEETGTNRDAGL